MSKFLGTFLVGLFVSSLSWAEVDLLPQFRNIWDGNWAVQTESGTSFYRAQTSASFSPSFVEYAPATPVSLEQKYLYLRVRVNSLKAWGGIEVRLSSDNDYQNYYAVAIPFYSDADFNILQPQQWADYTITLGEAKKIGNPDRKNINRIGFYIQGQTVDSADVFTVDFEKIAIRSSFHRGIVSFTFDDGYAEQFTAAQIMNKYGLRGTAYIMTNEIDDEGYLTSEQLKIMGDEYHWGISSHHAKPITDMTEAEFAAEMRSTILLTHSGDKIESEHSHGFAKDFSPLALPVGELKPCRQLIG